MITFLLKLILSHKTNGNKKHSPLKFMFGILTPIALLLSLVFVYWLIDDFWVTAQLLWLNRPPVSSQPYDEYNGGMQYTGGDYGDGVGGLSRSPSGLNIALIGAMSNGYYKDYLEIVRDHANWKYMSSEYKIYTDKSGEEMYPTVDSIIGISLAESALYKHSNEMYTPHTSLIPENYNSIDGYNLYSVTSEWFKQNGLDYINPMFESPGQMKHGSFRTQFQCSRSFFTLYPAEVVRNDDDYNRRHSYPSLLNEGYGQNSGSVREMGDRDASYFPDQVAITIGSAWVRYLESIDTSMVDKGAAPYICYAVHHAGSAGEFALGRSGSTLSDSSPSSSKNAAAGASNQIGNRLLEARNYFIDNIDSILRDSLFNFDEYESYWGLGMAMLIAGDNGFFQSQSHKASMLKKFDDNANFKNGFTLGCAILGESNNVRSILENTLVRTDISTSGYGNRTISYDDGVAVIYTVDPEVNVIYSNQSTVVPALHGWGQTDLRGIFRSAIGGPYCMWKMLQCGGVDCTFAEVCGYGSNDLISNIEGSFTSDNAQERIAELACLMSWAPGTYDGKTWTSNEIAFATWGNSMYVEVFRRLNSSWMLRCCAGFGTTVIRWSGTNNVVATDSTNGIRQILKRDSNWKLVLDGNPAKNIDKLKPGDICLYDTHTAIYVGDMCSKVYPELKGRESSFSMAHASITTHEAYQNCYYSSSHNSARSAKLSSTYSSHCTVFRYVGPDFVWKDPTGLTASEIAYLKGHPWQTNEQYHPSYREGSGGASSGKKITIKVRD